MDNFLNHGRRIYKNGGKNWSFSFCRSFPDLVLPTLKSFDTIHKLNLSLSMLIIGSGWCWQPSCEKWLKQYIGIGMLFQDLFYIVILWWKCIAMTLCFYWDYFYSVILVRSDCDFFHCYLFLSLMMVDLLFIFISYIKLFLTLYAVRLSNIFMLPDKVKKTIVRGLFSRKKRLMEGYITELDENVSKSIWLWYENDKKVVSLHF